MGNIDEMINIDIVKQAIRDTCFDLIDNYMVPEGLDGEQILSCVVIKLNGELLNILGIVDR